MIYPLPAVLSPAAKRQKIQPDQPLPGPVPSAAINRCVTFLFGPERHSYENYKRKPWICDQPHYRRTGQCNRLVRNADQVENTTNGRNGADTRPINHSESANSGRERPSASNVKWNKSSNWAFIHMFISGSGECDCRWPVYRFRNRRIQSGKQGKFQLIYSHGHYF